ncbi:hypothetical protein HNQ96_001756 [Aminobacter lissarensis]|uniref:DUF2214 domain-containing protein n=1 Tax=Aminobacter carboxidus TaxID=376165 RepID=A0A8E1WD92_9HYPH|nr:hypothetical protein [Aminobacter lissarensis]MBB6465898.1 hypothetical protein [Aminobacter lissarensis]
MEPFQAIEQLTFVRLLKASFVAYPVVNAVHIAAIGALLTSVTLLDLRILGALRTLPERPFMVLMRKVALLAFGAAALSGLLLFSVRASHYAQLPVFLAKMALIALAGTNFVVFAAVESGKQGHGLVLRFLALLSIVLWCATLLCGRFIGFL